MRSSSRLPINEKLIIFPDDPTLAVSISAIHHLECPKDRMKKKDLGDYYRVLAPFFTAQVFQEGAKTRKAGKKQLSRVFCNTVNTLKGFFYLLLQ